jgi:hypothetical protein
MKRQLVLLLACFISFTNAIAQTAGSTLKIPVSNADLGTFPYFKSFANYRPQNSSDSLTVATNQAFFSMEKNSFQ